MVLRGFKFLFNIVTGPGSRSFTTHSLQYCTYVLIFLSAVFKLFLAIDPYRIALYPITRLVAVPITETNGIDPNLGLSQKSCYGTKKA